MTEILVQVLLFVLIIVGIFMVVNFLKLYQILENTKEITDICKKRAKQFDVVAQNIEETISGLKSSAKTFLRSFGLFEIVKSGLEKIKRKG